MKKYIAFVLSSVLVISGLLAGGFGSIHAKAAEPIVTIQDILPADFPTSINSTWKSESGKMVYAYDGYLRFSESDDLYIPLNSVIDTSNNWHVNFTTSSEKVVTLEFYMEDGCLYSLYFDSRDQQYSSYQGDYRIRKNISDILPDGSVLPRYDAAIFTTESGDAYIYYDSDNNNLKVCSKDKPNIVEIPCDTKAVKNPARYECHFGEGRDIVKLNFNVIENKVASIELSYTGNPAGYIDDFKGTYAKRKTIAKILPVDFPVGDKTNQWANQYGHTIIYSVSDDDSIKFDISSDDTKNIKVSEKVVVSSSSSGVEYFYSDSDVTLKFSQPRGVLECINISGASVEEEYKGDYVKLKESYTVTNAAKYDDESTNHGYIAIDKDSAYPDETVTVTVYPSENYRLKSLPKYEISGKTYYASKGTKDNEYTFSMPDSDVTITAEFEQVIVPPSPTPSPSPTLTPKPVDPTKKFSDVPAGKWYSKPDGPVAYVVTNGIMKGTGDGSQFEPELPCTREMFVQILYNAEGASGAGPSNPFSDVKKGKWYYNAVTWALANNVTSGKSANRFGIGENVTREQLAQFLMNYAKKRGYDISARADVSKFPDAGEISGWAKEAVSWANANGIINGKAKNGKNYLAPKGNGSRAEIAQMIMNFQNKFGR